jgi:hypothetical protein
MADQATERAHIDAPPARCYEVATDFERYPEWAHDIKEATVVERDDEGRATLVAFRAAAMGRSARYTLAYDYGEAPAVLAWKLVEGDIMRKLDGSYRFDGSAERNGDGDSDVDGNRGTDVTYHLAVELVIPVPGFIKRRAEGKIIGTALSELKRRAENAS